MLEISLERGLSIAVLIVEGILVGHFLRTRLAWRYPFFILYLVGDAVWGVILMQVDYRSPAYAFGYRAYLLTMAVLRIGAVAELFERICSHITLGNSRFWMALWLLVISGLLSLVYFSPDLKVQHTWPQTCAMLIERYETAILSISLVLMRWYIRYIARPPIRPNVTAHWALLTTYLGAAAVASSAMLVMGGGRAVIIPLSVALLTADLLCLMAWIASMTKDGENAPPSWSEAGRARREEINRRARELGQGPWEQFLDGRD